MMSSLAFRDLLAQRPEGAWIVLSDACVDPRTATVGLGGALFNEDGVLISTWSQRATVRTRDTTVAELLALTLAAQKSLDAGISRVFAVADCQPSVMALNGNDAACSKAMDVVLSARATFDRFQTWGCGWAPRHRLSLPNDLARAGAGKSPENRQAVSVPSLKRWMSVGEVSVNGAVMSQGSINEGSGNAPLAHALNEARTLEQTFRPSPSDGRPRPSR